MTSKNGFHPKVRDETDIENQSIIFPGTEDNERIRISSRLIRPENGAEKLENWLIQAPADPKVRTNYDLFEQAVEKFPNHKFLGDRRHEGQDFKWKTYQEARDLSEKIGSALIQKCGVRPENSYRRKSRS